MTNMICNRPDLNIIVFSDIQVLILKPIYMDISLMNIYIGILYMVTHGFSFINHRFVHQKNLD